MLHNFTSNFLSWRLFEKIQNFLFDWCFLWLIACSFPLYANFSDKGIKGIIDSHPCFGRSFNKRAAKVYCEFFCLFHIHITSRQVTFVTHQDHRHIFRILYSVNLICVVANFLKWFGIVHIKNYETYRNNLIIHELTFLKVQENTDFLKQIVDKVGSIGIVLDFTY